MSNFRQAIEHCQLSTLAQRGDIYTWSNKHEENSFTKERLDRALISQKWEAHYNSSFVKNLVARNLDH